MPKNFISNRRDYKVTAIEIMFKIVKEYFKTKARAWYESQPEAYFFKKKGYCPCCDSQVTFIARHPWLRDYLRCASCKSIPRERALIHTIETYYPSWKNMAIHESSPSPRGHSIKLQRGCENYTETQYWPDLNSGAFRDGIRCEDLENQSFEDEVFDVVVTSDVMEHIYNPDKAFKEIHRTLKPGGAHIFSVPIINKHKPTQVWATKNEDGSPNFLYKPEWHGNPVDEKGSPVTMHWGYDIKEYIEEHTGAQVEIIHIDDLSKGIRAEYIEIIVAKKPK